MTSELDVDSVASTEAANTETKSFEGLTRRNTVQGLVKVRTLNRSLTPTKPALRNPKAKNTKRKMKRSVSFCDTLISQEVEAEKFSDDEEEEEEKETKEEPPKQDETEEPPKEPSESEEGEEQLEQSKGHGLRRTMSAGSANIEGRAKRTPLTAEERKAKKEARLKEAKAAAKNVRRQTSGRKLKVEPEAPQQQTKSMGGLFKNPFRRVKSLDVNGFKRTTTPKAVVTETEKGEEKTEKVEERSISPKRISRGDRRSKAAIEDRAADPPSPVLATNTRRQSSPAIVATPPPQVVPPEEPAPIATNSTEVEC